MLKKWKVVKKNYIKCSCKLELMKLKKTLKNTLKNKKEKIKVEKKCN